MMREKPIGYVWALAGLALLVGQLANAAEERIHRFHADIEVRQDGVLLVTETIEVTALGKKIKRGIYRDIPVVSSPTLGMRKVHGFSVIRVARDGRPEPYHLDSSGDLSRDVKRIYIGQANQQLEEGRYTYTLAYETSGWLLHHDLRDELYWNVTGNDWEFPIDQASVRVVLPAGYSREALEIGAWTGRKGSKARNWKLGNITSRQEVHLETTTPLARREGFAIGILWPADAVQRPSVEETREALLRDNFPSVVALLGLLGSMVVYLAAWAKVGKDPEPGMVVPRTSPPDLSPAAARYLRRMGYDHSCLAAALVSSASKEAVHLERNGGEYKVSRGGGNSGDVLADDERTLVDSLLGGKDSIALSRSNRLRIQKSVKSFQAHLKKRMVGKLFLNNRAWVLPGIIISLASVVVALFLGQHMEVSAFMMVWLTGWSFGVIMLVREAWRAWKSARSGGTYRPLKIFAAVFISIFALPFIAGEVLGLWLLAANSGLWVAGALVAHLVLAVVFWKLLKAPTAEGRALLDELDGYEAWLRGTLPSRVLQAPSADQMWTLFDQHLPWGIAMDLENDWSKELSSVLQLGQGTSSRLHSYHNHETWSSGGGAFSLGDSLSSAIATSSSSSSSSGGGGGSSGGGGGGGGGGGW